MVKLFHIILPVLAITACAEPESVYVSPEEYAKFGACWKNDKSEFSAFVTLVPASDGWIIYPISSKCAVRIDGVTENATFVLSTGAIDLSDTSNIMRSRTPNKARVISSSVSDLPPPHGSASVFYLVAKVRETNFGRSGVDVVSVEKYEPSRLTYIALAEKSQEERIAIGRRFDPDL